PIHTSTEFMEGLARLRPGESARLGIIRYGQRLTKTVKLGEFETERPEARPAPARPSGVSLLGFTVQPVTAEELHRAGISLNGAVAIQTVDPLSGAFEGGVARGLVIRSINGQNVTSVADVERIARGLRSGQTVTLVFRTQGQ